MAAAAEGGREGDDRSGNGEAIAAGAGRADADSAGTHAHRTGDEAGNDTGKVRTGITEAPTGQIRAEGIQVLMQPCSKLGFRPCCTPTSEPQ